MGAGLFQEIDAFCRLRRIEMSPWDVSMIWIIHTVHNTSKNYGGRETGASTGAGVAAVLRGLKAKREMDRGTRNG